MFTFLNPEFLYLMLLPSLILAYLLTTNRSSIERFFDKGVLEKMRAQSKSLSKTQRNALFFIALVLMIIAMARPVIEKGKIEIEEKSATFVLAIDISTSMLADDLYPSRLAVAKQKAKELIEEAKSKQVGILAFSTDAFVLTPLTADRESALFLLDNLDSSYISKGGTNLKAAISSAARLLENSGSKALVILSDGGEKGEFAEELALAKEHNLAIYFIALGSEKGSPIKLGDSYIKNKEGEIVISTINREVRELALESGGAYMEAGYGSRESKELYNLLKQNLQTKSKGSRSIDEREELFYIPLVGALFVMLLSLSSLPRGPKALLLTLLVLGGAPKAEALFFDFLDIDKAFGHYKAGDYNSSIRHFENLHEAKGTPQALYDLANSYYKAGDYKKAGSLYKRVQSEDAELAFRALHNLGNSYFRQQRYKEAVESYKKALRLKEDRETRENLKIAEKMLQNSDKKEQQQQQEQKKQKEQQKQNSPQRQENSEQEDPAQKEQQNRENKEGQKSSSPQNQGQQGAPQDAGKESKEQQEGASAKESRAQSISEMEAKKWREILEQSGNRALLYRMEKTPGEISPEENPW